MRLENLSHASLLRFALAASLVSLGAAFTAQYGFGLKPCHLCIAQRVPFGLVIALAIMGLWKARWRKMITLAIAALFLIDCGIAGYHAAVEKEWISGPSGCTQGEAPPHQSMEDFLKRIEQAPIVACDQPQWEFHGVTMAMMNAVWCLFLTAAMGVALQQIHRKQAMHA